MYRCWTKEELKFLDENWGTRSVAYLAEKLERSQEAVSQKAYRLGYSRMLDSGDYITFCQLLSVLGYDASNTYAQESWISNRGCPVRYKKVRTSCFRIIYIHDFWQWAEQNQYFLDFSKFKENVLGAEPEWAKRKRKNDIFVKTLVITTPWTKAEDEKLLRIVRQQKYDYPAIAMELRRTEGAIERRLIDLGCPDRPVKAHKVILSDSDKTALKDMIVDGYRYIQIAMRFGMSEKSIRGRVYRMYGSEDLDVVRRAIIAER